MVRVIHADLEKFLTGRIRAELEVMPGTPYAGVWVSNTFYTPDAQYPREPPPFEVVVRDDSGPSTGLLTRESMAGITVLGGGGDITDAEPVSDLARYIQAVITDCADLEPGNPVAAVLGSNGPYRVPDDSGRPRRYMTFTFSVVAARL